MSKSSFTASGQSNNSKQAVSSAGVSDEDFVMMCPLRDGGLNEAILALYYLPPKFKLRVLIDAATAKLPFSDHEMLKGRISLETDAGTPIEVSPFSQANAVVYSEATPVMSESATPRVVISKAAHKTLRSVDGNTFTISEDSPEALASAILNIAKLTPIQTAL